MADLTRLKLFHSTFYNNSMIAIQFVTYNNVIVRWKYTFA